MTRRPQAAPVRGRLNLAAVEVSLRHVQRLVEDPASDLGAARDPLDDRVVDNMLAGYAFVDALVAEGVDVMAMGQLRHLLEMNTLVLCGTDPARRVLYARHLEATERRLYEEPGGGSRISWNGMRATGATRSGISPPARARGPERSPSSSSRAITERPPWS